MIKVCDATMGIGKSSAAINWMNDHPREKYLFITPYISETERVQQSCPGLHFMLPENTIKEFDFNKREHLRSLLSKGKNIAMTHVLLSLVDDESLAIIREEGYTAIIDEAISVMSRMKEKQADVRVAMGSKYFRCEDRGDGEARPVEVVEDNYDGEWMKEIHMYAKSHRLVALKDVEGEDRLYCWMFNEAILRAPKDVIILTYLFRASPMYYLLQMSGLSFKAIGVDMDENGKFVFSEEKCYVPDYCHEIKSKLTVVDNKRMNAVGNRYNALSKSWQVREARQTRTGQAEKLKKNLSNFFNNINRGLRPNERLWTCFDEMKGLLSDKGYTKRWLVFNQRATNDYRMTKALAYCVNVYMPVWEQKYYEQHGVEVFDDEYALSTMIQWIWRSNIREGGAVTVYVPSRRMREFLLAWMDDLENGKVSGLEIGKIYDPPMSGKAEPVEAKNYNEGMKGA